MFCFTQKWKQYSPGAIIQTNDELNEFIVNDEFSNGKYKNYHEAIHEQSFEIQGFQVEPILAHFHFRHAEVTNENCGMKANLRNLLTLSNYVTSPCVRRFAVVFISLFQKKSQLVKSGNKASRSSLG